MQQLPRHTSRSRPWLGTAVNWAVWILAAYILVAAAVSIFAA